jgi:hypothetical protein
MQFIKYLPIVSISSSRRLLLQSARQLPFHGRFPVALCVVSDSGFPHEAGAFFPSHTVDRLEFSELFIG